MACLIVIFTLIICEAWQCNKKASPSGMLIFLLFDFVFLHFWMLVDIFGYLSWHLYPEVNELTFYSDAFLAIGYACVNFMFRKQKLPVACVVNLRPYYMRSYWVLFVLCAILVIYYFSVNGISLMADDVDLSRHEARKGQGYLNIFLTRGLPIAIAGLVALYATKHRSFLTAKIVFLILVGASVQLLSSFRANIIFFVLLIWFIQTNMFLSFNIRSLLKIGIAALVFFAFVTIIKYRSDFQSSLNVGLSVLWGYVEHRIVMEIPWVIEKQIDLVNVKGYQYGATYLMDLYSALPGPGDSYGDYLMAFANPSGAVTGLAALTPSMIGESYVNFGVLGVAVVSAAVPFLFKALEIRRSSVITVNELVFRTMMDLFVANAVMLGFGTLLASRIIPMLVFVGFLFAIQLILGRGRVAS